MINLFILNVLKLFIERDVELEVFDVYEEIKFFILLRSFLGMLLFEEDDIGYVKVRYIKWVEEFIFKLFLKRYLVFVFWLKWFYVYK